MSSVTHAGRTVITDIEGGWIYTPGHKGATGQAVYPVRSKVGYWKPLTCTAGEHSLSVDFVGSSGDVDNFRARITDLYDNTVGTLSVGGFGSVGRCVFSDKPSFSEVKALADNEFLITVEMRLLEL